MAQTIRILHTDGQSWPLILSSLDSPLFDQQASHCKAAWVSADVKSPILSWVDCSNKMMPTCILLQIRADLALQMSLSPPLSLLPITQTWVSFQRLAQSSIQSFPVTDAHLACRWTEKEKKASQCFSTLAWESLGILGFFTSLNSDCKTNQKVANGFIQPTERGCYNSVSKTINAQKSGNPRLTFPHPTTAFYTQVTLVPAWTLNCILGKVQSHGGSHAEAMSATGE